MTEYEVQFRALREDDDDAPWSAAPRTSIDADSIEIAGLEDGVTYEVRIRVLAPGGVSSAWATYRHTVEAPAREVQAVAAVVAGDADCLSWNVPDGTSGLAGFEIRTAPGDHRHWASAEPAHQGLVAGPPFSLCGVAGGLRSYLVRAVDVAGNRGRMAVLVGELKPLADPHALVLFAEDIAAGGFTGGAVNGEMVGPDLATSPESPNILWPKGTADAAVLWNTTPGALLWSGPLLWLRPAGGEAKLWDTSSLLWGQRYKAATYTKAVNVPRAAGSAAARLTIEAEVSSSGWRLEYRRQRDLLWRGPDEPLWDNAPGALLWPVNRDPWLPWPGKLDRPGFGLYELRVVLPGGTTRVFLSELEVTVSRVP